jgi:hypothetical protein
MTKEEYHHYLLDNINKMNWLPIPEYEGYYEESDWGLTKSLERIVGGSHNNFRIVRERILKPTIAPNGRFIISLSLNNIQKYYQVSRLVLRTFVGPCPEGMECLHGPDFNVWNNKLDNLRWGTKEENMYDKIANGTDACCGKNPNAKLNQEQVNQIRNLYAAGGYTNLMLAKKFEIGKSQINSIINYNSWKVYE